jgi:HAD superfamily hydrolase (TIGR01484 family)
MTYKAIVFDLDGTTIPNNRYGKASARVIEAVKKAQKHVHTVSASGRPTVMCRAIFADLNLTAPCIVDGGSMIVDPTSEKVLWERYLPNDTVTHILKSLQNYPYPVFFSDEPDPSYGKPAAEKNLAAETRKVLINEVDPETITEIMTLLGNIQEINAHTVQSWVKGKIDIHITHESASKKHALEELSTMLNITTAEIIAVGDSNNDTPLLEAAGLKVAMGNATPELKEFADYVAPSVDEDGLAHVIEKFILS